MDYHQKEMRKILLELSSPPPAKQTWAHPEFSKRNIWSRTFEAISYFFLSSNSIRKNYILDIVIKKKYIIRFDGGSLRYLSMSMRSAASLVYKAYNSNVSYDWKESSPGVYMKKIDGEQLDLKTYFATIYFLDDKFIFNAEVREQQCMMFYHPSQIITYLNYHMS